MEKISWLYRIAFRKGFWRRRWLLRPLAFLGVAALLLPLAQPLLRPPEAAPQVEAADLGWSDARPPLTDIGDNVPPFRPLPAFGDVDHALTVAPNGDLFTAGGPDSSGNPSRYVYKSVDGGKSWRSSQTPCGNIKSIRLSPSYSDPSAPDATVVILCHNKLAISRNAGLSWTDGPTTVDKSAGEENTSFALSPDFNGAKGGVILVGNTGVAAAHTKWVTWDGVTGTFGPVNAMPDGAGVSPQDSALAVAFPPGFTTAALPAAASGGMEEVSASWSKTSNISNTPSYQSKQPDVAVESDGTVHAVWYENFASGEIYYASKPPGGAWSTPVNISNYGEWDRKPAIAVDSSGNVHVVWERYYYSVGYATKPKGGSWSSPVSIGGYYNSYGPQYNYAYYPDIAVDGSGALHAVWRWSGGCNYDTQYATKAPGGSWTGYTTISDGCNYSVQPAVAADSSGTVHVAWESYCSSCNEDIYYSSKPAGGSFSTPVNISNNSGDSRHPAIAADKGGGAHVVWEDYSYSGYGEIYYAGNAAGGGFSTPRNISNTPSGYSDVPSIAADKEGGLHVLWTGCCYVGSDWDILYVNRTPEGIWSSPENISKNSGYSRHPSIAAGGNSLHAVWWDDDTGNQEIFHSYRGLIFVPSIKLEPPSGKAGDTIKVTGRYFNASSSAAVSFDGTQLATATVAASPTTFTKYSGDSQNGTVAAALTSPFVVELKDNLGAPIVGAAAAFAIGVTPDGATGQALSVTSATTDANGRASTTLTLGSKSGIYLVSASTAGVTDVVFKATAKPGTAVAVKCLPGCQFSQNGKVGTTLAPYTATLVDSLGNGVPDKAVTFSIATFPGSDTTTDTTDDATGQDIDKDTAGAQSTLSVKTDANGEAAATLTLGDTLGSYTVAATIDLNSDGDTLDSGESQTFYAMATSLQPTQLNILSGNTQTGTVGAALANPLAVQVKDAAGLPVNGARVFFSIYTDSTPAGAAGQSLAPAPQFSSPPGVAVDASGNVYVADTGNQRIRKVTPGGAVSTLAGSGGAAGFADGPGSTAQFNYPEGVAVDSSGNVYVADTNNNRIRKVTPAGTVTTLAGSGAAGFADGPGSTAQFNNPKGVAVAVDSSGNVYVADYNNHRIRKVTAAGTVSTLAGTGAAGYADNTDPALAKFNNPNGVAVDASGNVYVADRSNNRIRKVAADGTVTTLAGSGAAGFADNTDPILAQFNLPHGVAVGASGNVYVADLNNHRIRKVTAAGEVSTLAGSGAAGYADGPATTAQFNNPTGVAVDSSGNVYVGDYTNHRIRKVTSAGQVSTLAGFGTSGYADGPAPPPAQTTDIFITTGPDGKAQVALTLGNKTGQYRVFTKVGAPDALMLFFTATANPLGVGSRTLSKASGDSQTGLMSAPLGKPLVAAVKDTNGNGVPSIALTFTIATIPANAAGQQLLGGAMGAQTVNVTTDTNGEAAATLVLGNAQGDYTVTATCAAAVCDTTALTVTFTATASNKTTLPAPPTSPALLPPAGSFETTFVVPSASNGTHVVEAVGKKGTTASGDKGSALFSIGNIIRIYWNSKNRIEEQGAPLLGAWPAPGAAANVLLAATPDLVPPSQARGIIRLPSGATSLDNYWLGLDLSPSAAPSDLYRRVSSPSPAFVDTNVGGAGTDTRITGLAPNGPFDTGTVFVGVPKPEPRVYKSANGGQTWPSFVSLHQSRGAIGAGSVVLGLLPKSSTEFELYATTAGSKGGVHRSTATSLASLGAAFSDTGLTNAPYNNIYNMAVFMDGTAFAVTQNTGLSTDTAIFRTTNFGPEAKWERVDRRDNVSAVYPPWTVTTPLPSNAVLYALRSAVSSQQILKSNDAGLSFAPTTTDPGTGPIGTIYAASGDVVLAGSEMGKVWRSADGGATWTASTTDLGGRVMALNNPGDFSLGPPAAGALFASVMTSGGTMEAFITTDGAVTFKQVGSSAGAWGIGGSYMALTGMTLTSGYMLWARPQNAGDNDIFRAVVDPANPAAAMWKPLGAPDPIKGTASTEGSGALGFQSMVISSTLASGIGDGLLMYLVGRPKGGGPGEGGWPVNTIWRTYYPKTVTAATWNKLFLPGVPVDRYTVPYGSSPESRFPYYGNRDVTIASAPVSSTQGRMIVVRDFNSPSRILTWTDTPSFLTPPTLTEPANGAVFNQGRDVQLRWGSVPLGVVYQIEVAKDPDFNARIQSLYGDSACPYFESYYGGSYSSYDPLAPGVETTTAIIPYSALEQGVQYFWHARVCGVNSTEGAEFAKLYPGPWSEARSFSVALGPAITLTPNNGVAGDTVSFTVERMPAGEVLAVNWDNPYKLVAAPTVGNDGKATGSFKVPEGAPLGPHIVRAEGAISGKATAAAFQVMSPTPAGAPTFKGKVALQVMGAAGDARWLGYRLLITLFTPGSTTPTAKLAVDTNDMGEFSATITDLPAGSYDIHVKGYHTLSNKKANVALPQASGAAAIDFGTLKTGDLSSNDAILGDDYSILVTNFGQSGPATVASAGAQILAAVSPISLKLAADSEETILPGQMFTVELKAQAGAQPVDAVDLFLNFNPNVIRVVDEASSIAAGGTLAVVLQNRADNEAGRIAFSAGREPLAQSPVGDYVVATIRFKALLPISVSALPMAFSYELPRLTGAYYNGQQLIKP